MDRQRLFLVLFVFGIVMGCAVPAFSVHLWDIIDAAPAEAIRALLDLGADPFGVDNEGLTLMHRAARNNPDPEVIEVLHEFGLDLVYDQDLYGGPLREAARYNTNPAVTEILLDLGAFNYGADLLAAIHNPEPNVLAVFLQRGMGFEFHDYYWGVDAPAYSIHHEAAYHRKDPQVLLEILDLYLKHGLGPSSAIGLLETVLTNWELGEGGNAVATFLWEKGKDVNIVDLETPSILDIAKKNPWLRSELLAEMQQKNETLNKIVEIVRNGSVQQVQDLFSSGRLPADNLDSHPYLANVAAENQDEGVLSFLLELGLDVTSQYEFDTPIYAAARRNTNPEVFRLLAQAGASLNPLQSSIYDYPPLLAAMRCGNVVGVKTLLELGANVHTRANFSRFSHPAIHEAAPFPEILELLLEYGADPNDFGDYDQSTPLFRALKSPESVAMLIEAGADVNYENWWGNTPLTTAIEYGASVESVAMLIEAGADVNYEDRQENTPLTKAIEYGSSVEVVRLLLKSGSVWPQDISLDSTDVDVEILGLFAEFASEYCDKRLAGLKGPVAIMVAEKASIERYFDEFKEGERELLEITLFDVFGNLTAQFLYEKIGEEVVPLYRNYGQRDELGRLLRITERMMSPENLLKGFYVYEYGDADEHPSRLRNISYYEKDDWYRSFAPPRLKVHIEVEYDPLGREVERRHYDHSNQLIQISHFSDYNFAGYPRVIDERHPQSDERFLLDYEYDGFGNPVKILVSNESYSKGSIFEIPVEARHYTYGLYSEEKKNWDPRLQTIWDEFKKKGYYSELDLGLSVHPLNPQSDGYVQNPGRLLTVEESLYVYKQGRYARSTNWLAASLGNLGGGYWELEFQIDAILGDFYNFEDYKERALRIFEEATNSLFQAFPSLKNFVMELIDSEKRTVLRIGRSAEQWSFLRRSFLRSDYDLPEAIYTLARHPWTEGSLLLDDGNFLALYYNELSCHFDYRALWFY